MFTSTKKLQNINIVIYLRYSFSYKYHFPFLRNIGAVKVDDNRVGPLYKHVFPPTLAPGISFVGLPWKVRDFLYMFCHTWLILVPIIGWLDQLLNHVCFFFSFQKWCQVVPFILCELQSRWIAGTLSGRIPLPSEEKMMDDIEAFYAKLDAAGIPKRYTHNIGDHQVLY